MWNSGELKAYQVGADEKKYIGGFMFTYNGNKYGEVKCYHQKPTEEELRLEAETLWRKNLN